MLRRFPKLLVNIAHSPKLNRAWLFGILATYLQ
jgi:hypothetical protein